MNTWGSNALKDTTRYKTAAILFGGIGGETIGLMRSKVEYGGKLYQFKILCSIDYDPVACHNHDLIAGEKTSVCMDLFNRQQYIDWHGHEPPDDWREATAWDLWEAFGHQVPFFLFTSPPCKGLSGLLPEGKASTKKYQALNFLTVRGLELALEACTTYGDGVPAIIQMENVPRITSRGKNHLNRIEKLLKKYGFAISMRSDHNLGEIGGLGQERVRFLKLSRDEKQIPNFINYPQKKPMKTIGDVLGPLPPPGDTEAGGPLHRLPNLQWKTWVRLALIPAGGDWRDLNKIDWKQYRVMHEPRGGALAVEDWNKAARTVTGTAGPGRSNGAAAVSDPQVKFKSGTHATIYRVCRGNESAPTVTGAHRPNNGAICISDPQLRKQEGKHPGVYRVVRVDEPAPCVTGTRFGSGAIAIADPTVKTDLMPDSYGVQGMDETAKAIRGHSRIMQSATSIADPRIPDRPGRYTDKFRVQSVDGPAATVTGVTDVQSGAQMIADPKMECAQRAGTLGVQAWEKSGSTVAGYRGVYSGCAAVADPRIPDDREGGVWIIIAEDGTWHRPLTTYELAMLQSFPTHLPDGRPFQLEGCSDQKAREYIGNAVPRDSAEAMGNVVLFAAAQAEAGETFSLSFETVWVNNNGQRITAQMVH
jgi:site-specific DNA-cytosine methylase